MITKKHYEKFAALFAGEIAMARAASDYADTRLAFLRVRAIVLSTADIFAQDNPRFDREVFYKACGL